MPAEMKSVAAVLKISNGRPLPLVADTVEKLENRGAPKISRIGDFSRCKAL
jgi:hypothetical protein